MNDDTRWINEDSNARRAEWEERMSGNGNEAMLRESFAIKQKAILDYALEVGAMLPIAKDAETVAAIVQVANLLMMAGTNLKELSEGKPVSKWEPVNLTAPLEGKS